MRSKLILLNPKMTTMDSPGVEDDPSGPGPLEKARPMSHIWVPDKYGAHTKTKEVPIMKTCPITRQECIGNACQWWSPSEPIKPNCALLDIARELHDIRERLILMDGVIMKIATAAQ